MATFGLNNALISIVAYNLGTQRHDRIKKTISLSTLYSALIGLLGTILLQIFPTQIMRAFNASETMTQMGITALRLTSLSFVFACISIMACYALQGLSMGVSSMLISAARQVILLLPFAFVLGKLLGVNGVWLSFPLTELLVMIVACGYLGFIKKTKLL